MKILVVDDSDDVRSRFAALIAESGVREVHEADDGFAAIAKATMIRPSVVLLDLNLPGKTGFFVLETLKRLHDPPSIVVATNHATEAHRRRCLALGADAFFDKSGDFARIVAVVVGLARTRPESE